MKRILVLLAIVGVVFFGINQGWFDKLGSFASSPTSPTCTWDPPALAAEVVTVPVDAAHLDRATPAVEAGVGGVLLFGTAPKDLGAQIATLVSHAPKGRAPIIMADEEGGLVQRLEGIVDPLPSAPVMAKMSLGEIQAKAAAIGTQMKQLGVMMDLAPVVDLDDRNAMSLTVNPDSNRSFGVDPTKTSQDSVAFAKGLMGAGIVPVAKHFPGLGYSSGNTDLRPAHTLDWTQLQKTALVPFKAAIDAGVPAVMTSNAGVPGLTNLPASLSPEVTKALRDLGFKGIIITDTLSAKAISANGYNEGQATVAALNAGADLILYGTPATPASMYGDVTGAIVAAMASGKLPRDKVVAAANAVMATKHLGSCD